MDPAAILVGLGTLVSGFAAWRASRQAGQANKKLDGNGMGPVAAVLELLVEDVRDIKDWTVRHEGRHDLLEERLLPRPRRRLAAATQPAGKETE